LRLNKISDKSAYKLQSTEAIFVLADAILLLGVRLVSLLGLFQLFVFLLVLFMFCNKATTWPVSAVCLFIGALYVLQPSKRSAKTKQTEKWGNRESNTLVHEVLPLSSTRKASALFADKGGNI